MSYEYRHSDQEYWDRLDGKYGFLVDIEVKCTFCDKYETVEDVCVDSNWEDDELDFRYFEAIDGYPCCHDCAEKMEQRGCNVKIILFEELPSLELFNYDRDVEQEPDWDFIRKSKLETEMVKEQSHAN